MERIQGASARLCAIHWWKVNVKFNSYQCQCYLCDCHVKREARYSGGGRICESAMVLRHLLSTLLEWTVGGPPLNDLLPNASAFAPEWHASQREKRIDLHIF